MTAETKPAEKAKPTPVIFKDRAQYKIWLDRMKQRGAIPKHIHLEDVNKGHVYLYYR